MTSKTKKDVYELVTAKLLEQMEGGTIPWMRPWKQTFRIPQNLTSKKNYRGINIWLLNVMGYESPYWLTYNQAKTMGGQVRKGEKGCPVIYWNWIEKPSKDIKDSDGNPVIQKIPFLRYYTVFNTEQVDGIEKKVPDYKVKSAEKFNPIERAETLVADCPSPKIKVCEFEGAAPSYLPQKDIVEMPPRQSFITPDHYYATRFHECVHATGHKDRLNRKTLVATDKFGGVDYSQEELVAEFGASYLCGLVGIDRLDVEHNAVGYLQNWIKALKGDKKMAVMAAAQAQKATDWLTKEWRELEVENVAAQ